MAFYFQTFYLNFILQIIINNAFTCANNVESLVNNLFGVKIFNPVPTIFLFWGFNFALSAIVSSGSKLAISLSHSSGGMLDKSSLPAFTLSEKVSHFLLYRFCTIYDI